MTKAKAMDYIASRDDINAVRDYLRLNYNFGDMYALLFTCGCNLGLRASDLRLLTFGNLRLPQIVVKEIKTKKNRQIFINQKVSTEFSNYLNGHRYNNAVRSYVYVNDNANIFVSRKGDPLSTISIYRIIRQACSAVGLVGDFGSHTMRKTFAYHCYQITSDIHIVQRLLLHSDAFVTRVYVSVNNLDNKEVLDITDRDVYLRLNL